MKGRPGAGCRQAAALCAVGLSSFAGEVFGPSRLFDATDPAAMVLDIEGRYLYGGAGDRFVVFDLADPLAPRKVGSVRAILRSTTQPPRPLV